VLGPDGSLTVATGLDSEPGSELDPGPDEGIGEGRDPRIGVNREFLLQALNARQSGQLLLELDGPIAPLTFRDPQRAGSFSLLMPTRLPPTRVA
jgi:DNA polymerase III sliding clamp (beta) subunit (PCNA family)